MSLTEKLRVTARRVRRNGTTLADLAADIDGHGQRRKDGIRQRISELTSALAGAGTPIGRKWRVITPVQSTEELLELLFKAIGELTPATAWLMLATIEGQLPTAERVRAAVRTAALDGLVPAVRLAIWSGPLPRYLDNGPWHPVQIVTDRIVVDVHHTAQTDFATGIQRVTREATRRWLVAHQPILIGWRPDTTSMRALTPKEVHRACWGGPAVDVPSDDPILVPWRCTYILPELAAEVTRTQYLLAMAEHSGNPLNIIGYDLVPVTTSETSHEGLIPGSPAIWPQRGTPATSFRSRSAPPVSTSAGETCWPVPAWPDRASSRSFYPPPPTR